MEDVCMKKVYHVMLMRGGILIGDVNNYTYSASHNDPFMIFIYPTLSFLRASVTAIKLRRKTPSPCGRVGVRGIKKRKCL
jgi:hypothetical protein